MVNRQEQTQLTVISPRNKCRISCPIAVMLGLISSWSYAPLTLRQTCLQLVHVGRKLPKQAKPDGCVGVAQRLYPRPRSWYSSWRKQMR